MWALAGLSGHLPGVGSNQRGPWPAWEATSVGMGIGRARDATSVGIDWRGKQPAWALAGREMQLARALAGVGSN